MKVEHSVPTVIINSNGRKDFFFKSLRGMVSCVSNDWSREILHHVSVSCQGVAHATCGRAMRTLDLCQRFKTFTPGCYSVESSTAGRVVLSYRKDACGKYPNVDLVKVREGAAVELEAISGDETDLRNTSSLYHAVRAAGANVDPELLLKATRWMDNPVPHVVDDVTAVYIKDAAGSEAWIMPLRLEV